MTELPYQGYDFDEEQGFEEPARAEPMALPAAQKVGLALVGLGLLALIVQVSGGPLAGT